MKRMLMAVICCLLAIFNVIYALPASAQSDSVRAVRDGIALYEQQKCGAQSVQEWIDSALAANAGAQSETYILALHQSGTVYDYSAYSRSLLKYLDEKEISNASTRQKYALALLSANCRSEYIAETADETIGQLGIMSWIFGLHLLNNGVASSRYTVQEVVGEILSLRLPDGGWAISGEVSDVDVTAMAVQALAPRSEDGAVAAAVEEAVAFLSTQQLDSGAYASYGVECAESTAQVIIALCALDIDSSADERFVKNGNTLFDGLLQFRQPDGSFAHSLDGGYNHMATAQAFAALTAMERQRSGLGSLYVLDAQPDNTVEYVRAQESSPANWRGWVCAGIAAAAAGCCVLLYVRGKRNVKSYAVVVVAAAVAAVLTFTLDIQTADQYYGSVPSKTDIIGTVTVTIRCDTIAGDSDSPYIPTDGVILDTTEMAISEGDTAYDILVEAARKHTIHLESSGSPGMNYIAGINHIYELEHGELSGWIYRVNGQQPPMSCGAYTLSDGDCIEWLYTCDIGKDLD